MEHLNDTNNSISLNAALDELQNDPLFGTCCTLELNDFFEPEKLKLLKCNIFEFY
jgi:hypothetical protein